jgi:hypothetical protein
MLLEEVHQRKYALIYSAEAASSRQIRSSSTDDLSRHRQLKVKIMFFHPLITSAGQMRTIKRRSEFCR